ncbi:MULTISPECIES: nitroreductase family protein [unclassified Streptomyces]|uniref:nitroreductase family protein n=1 Tax=unclassified Streptomyces TaxID=2593676 RepID=UPI000B89495F|nr:MULTISPECIES: nitroreductase family protein [unclassified Streptomyces]MYR92212.1 nitroreductase [Streptomyces sp. SID4937]
MGYAHEYAAAIMHRGRVPMDPADYVPNWQDGPRKAKFYPGADSFPLPDAPYPADATLDRGLCPEEAPDDGEFDLATLSGMLRDSYGLTGRRLGVQANTDLSALPFYPLANWSRGSASGGGLYPVGVHWISGPSGPVPPGVHYYSTRHHAMQRLLTGDVSGQVRAALGEGAPGPATDQYLVLSIKFWQNSFKYNSFSFHAVSMDLGACVQTWRMWAAARGLAVEPAFWFDEERLAALLGADPKEEGIFAVVPLKWAGYEAGSGATTTPAAVRSKDVELSVRRKDAELSVQRKDVERSRTVLTFDALLRMQAATSADATARPAPGALAPAAAHPVDPAAVEVELPPARPLETDVRTALRDRRSSFGRFEAQQPVTRPQLAACLAAAVAGSRLGGDTGDERLAKLYVFASHVEGVEPGSYAYDPERRSLRRVKEGRPGEFLQRNYFLANYNLEQAGAVLVPTVRTTAVLDAVGDRGYRLVNATIGAVAQSVYTAASAVDLGCGVALGFDNISYIEELGLEGTGEAPLLIMMIGNERPAPADFRYEIA